MKRIITSSIPRLLAFLLFIGLSQASFGQIQILENGNPIGNSITGCAPLNVTFQANDEGANTEYQWNFGDGNSTIQAPYATIGTASRIFTLPDNDPDFIETYTVTLTVTNTSTSATNTYTATVTVQVVPEPVFTATPREGCLVNGRHTVEFTAPTGFASYDWEFGDGSSANTNSNVYTHDYTAQGDFLPSLIVTDAQGCRASYNAPPSEQISISNSFTVGIELDGDDFSCTTPHTVTVRATDLPTPPDAPLDIVWDFGDASNVVNTGTEEYEVTWDTPGVKTVGFDAEQNGCYQQRRTRDILIDQIVAEFQTNNGSGCAPLSSQFINTTANLPNNQQIATWRIYDNGGVLIDEIIRDGTVGDNVTTLNYDFPDPDTNFEVELQVQDANTPPNCESTSSREAIQVFPEVSADFTADPIFSCTIPHSVTFDASTSVNATNYNWEFTDINGNVVGTANGVNPTFAFNNYGIFGARLTVSANGCTDEVAFDQLITIEPLEADFSFLPPDRCVPTNAEAFGLVVGGCVNPSTSLTYSPQLFNLSNGVGAGTGTTYLWEVIEGGATVATSTMANPTDIVLVDEGRYTVRLTLTNACGTIVEEKPDYIWVGLQPDNIDFEATPKIICNREQVNYPRINIDDNDDLGGSPFPAPEYFYNYFEQDEIIDQNGFFTYAYSDPNPVTANMWYYHNGCFECVEDKDPAQHYSNIKLPRADAEFFFDACQPEKIFFNDLSLVPDRDRNEIVADFNAGLPLPFPPAAIEWSFTYDDDGTDVTLDVGSTLNDASPVIVPDSERLINWSITVRASCDPTNPFTRCDDPADEDTYTCQEVLTGTVTLPEYGAPNWDALLTNGNNGANPTPLEDECAPYNGVQFNGSNINIPGANIVSYYLEFGNGQTLRSNDQTGFTATTDYPLPGLYSLRMVLTTDRGCRFEHIYPDWIRVTGPQAIFDFCESGTCADEAIDATSFFITPDKTADPPVNQFGVRFNDLSTSQDDITLWNWEFGDGTTLEIIKVSDTQYDWTWQYDPDGDDVIDATRMETKNFQDVVYYSYNRTELDQDDFFEVSLRVSDGSCTESVTTGKVRPTKPEVVVEPAEVEPFCFGSLVTLNIDVPNTSGIQPFQGATWEVTNANVVEVLENYHPTVPVGTYNVVTLFDYNFNNNRWEIQQTLSPTNGDPDIVLNRNDFNGTNNQNDLAEVKFYFPGVDGELYGTPGTPTVYDAELTLFDVNTCPDIKTIPSFQIENYSFDLDFNTSLDPNSLTDNTLFDRPGVPELFDGTPSGYTVDADPSLSVPFYVGGCPPQDLYVNALIGLRFTAGADETNQDVTSFDYTTNTAFNATVGDIDFTWEYIGDETVTKSTASPPHFFTYPNPQSPVDPYDVALRIVDNNGCFAELSYQDLLDLRGPRGSFTLDEPISIAEPTLLPNVQGYADPNNEFRVSFLAAPDDPINADYTYVWDYGVGITSGGSTDLTSEFIYTENFINVGEESKEYVPKLIMIDGTCSVNARETPVVTVYRCPQPDLGPDQTLCVSEGDVVLRPFPDGYVAPMPDSELQFQWYEVDEFGVETVIPGATDATLTVTAMPGEYRYRVHTSVEDDVNDIVCVFDDPADPRFTDVAADNEVEVIFYDFADAVFNITPVLSTSAGYGGAEVICAGEEITITDNSTGPFSGAVELDILEWNWTITQVGTGTVVFTENRTTNDPVLFTPADPDTYEIRLEIVPEAINGTVCGDVITSEFIAVPPPEPDFVPTEVCYNEPTTFTNNTIYAVDQAINEANATYLWEFFDPTGTRIDAYTSTDFEPTVTFVEGPTDYSQGQVEYTATLTVSSNIKDTGTGDDDTGCEEISNPIIIRVNPLPEIDFTDVEACPEEIIEIRPLVTNPNFSYSWSQTAPTTGGTIEFYSDPAATIPALLSNGLEAYYLRLGSFAGINTPVEAEFQLLVTDNTFTTLCQVQENISIRFNPLPEIDQLDQEECEDVDITTGTTADPNHERFEWSFANPADEFTNGTVQYFIPSDLGTPRTLAEINASNGGLGQREITVRADVDAGLNEMVGTLQLEVFTANGCSDLVQNRIQFNPIPELELGVDQEVCEGTDVTLGIPSETGFQYVWTETITGGTVQYFDPTNLTAPLTIAGVNAANLSEVVVRDQITGQNTINLGLELEIIDTNFPTNCQNVDNVAVQFNPLPDVDQLDQSACEDARITTGTTAEPNRRYQWAISTAFSNGTPSLFTPSGNPISLSAINTNGGYNEIQVGISNIADPSVGVLELTVINTVTNCENVAQNQLTFNPLPIVELGPDQEVCENTDVTIGIASNAGFRYIWTPLNLNGGSFQYFRPTNLTSPLTIAQVNTANLNEVVVRGVFTGQNPVTADFELEVIDQRFGTNCTTTDDITLQFNPEPENPLVANPPAVCEDEAIVVSVPGLSGFRYEWELLTPSTILSFTGVNNTSRDLSQITGPAVTVRLDPIEFPVGQGILSYDIELTIIDENYPTNCENTEVITIDFYRTPKTETQAVKPGDEGSQEVALSFVEEDIDTFQYQWTQVDLRFGTVQESSLTGHTLTINNPVYGFGEPEIKGQYVVRGSNIGPGGDPTCEGENYVLFTLFRIPNYIDIVDYKDEPCSDQIRFTPVGDEYIPEFLYNWSVENIRGGDVQVMEAPTDTLFISSIQLNSFDSGSAVVEVDVKLNVTNSLNIDKDANAAEVTKTVFFYRTPDFEIDVIKADSCAQEAAISTTEELITGFNYQWTEKSISGGTLTNSNLGVRTVNLTNPQYDVGSHKIRAEYELKVVNSAENACQLTKELPVEIYRTPQVAIQKDQDNICQDERITLSPIDEPVAGFDYTWELVSITEGCHLDINAVAEPVFKQHTIWLDNPTFAPQATVINATYKLVAFNKDAPSCRNEATVDVTVYRTPTAQAKFEVSDVCQEDTIYLDLYQAKVDNFDYQWSLVNGTLEGGTITLTDADEYLMKANLATFTGTSTKVSAKMRIDVTNPGKTECNAQDEIDIAFFRRPDISISVDKTEACEDDSFTFTLNEAVNDGYTYAWDLAGIEGGSVDVSEQNSSSLTVVNPTFDSGSSKITVVYRLRASNSERLLCYDEDSKQVTFYRTPKVVIPQPEITCGDLPLILSPNEENIEGFTYEWVGAVSGGTLTQEGLDSHELVLKANTFNNSTLISGNYRLKVTNKEFPSCTAEGKVNVSFSKVPTLLSQEDLEFCKGATFTLNATNTLEANVVYRWFELNENGANVGTASTTTELVLNDDLLEFPGTRFFRILAFDPTNPANCEVDDTVRVTVFPSPIVSFDLNNSISSQGTRFINTTTLQTNAAGELVLGSEITEWLWDFGDGSGTSTQQNPTYQYNQAGTYQVKLTAKTNNGCEASFIREIKVNPKPTAVFNVSDACISSQPVQFFETSTLEVPTGADDVIDTWIWNFGDESPIRQGKNPTHSYENPGTYAVTLVVGTNNNAFDTLTKEVTIFPVIAASFNSQNTCAGQLVTFQHILNDETLKENIEKYVWDFGNGETFISESANQNTSEILYESAGIYTISLTVTTKQGCEETATQQVSIHPSEVAKFTYGNNCIGEEVRFESISTLEKVDGIDTRIVSYAWDFGDETTYNSIDAADRIVRHAFNEAGMFTITLTATTDLGCSTSTQQVVTINPVPVAAFSVSELSCGNAEVTLTSESTIDSGNIVSYAWDFGDDATYESTSAADSSASHKYSTYGVFTVKLTVTSDSGCVNTLVKDILVNPAPVARLEAPIVCEGSESTFDASLSTVALGQIISYEWDLDNDGSYEISTDQSMIKNTFETFGEYPIKLKITSDKGCVDTLSLVYKVTPFPLAGFNSTLACIGNPTDFRADINTAFGEVIAYEWDFDYNGTRASFDAEGTEVSFTYPAAGRYQVLHKITTASGCTDEIVKIVDVFDLPTVDAGEDQFICIGESITLSATGNGDEFAWNTGATSPTIEVTPTENTSYIVSVTTEIGCFSYDTVNVVILPKVDLEPIAKACEGEIIQLTASNTEISKFSNVSYAWSNNETTASIDVTESGTYTVRVVVSEGGKQCISIDSTVVTIHPLPTNILPQDTTACFDNGPIIFDIDSAGVVAWSWRELGVSTSKVSVSQEGLYRIDLFTEEGCTDTDSIRVWQVCEPEIYLPTAFTPNDDGLNDTFLPKGKYFVNYELMIYNRWGEVIFRTRDPFEGWDGIYLFDEMPAGTYAYTVKYSGEKISFNGRKVAGKLITEYGSVSLIR